MPERKCLNCSTSYNDTFKYCPNCGQKNAPLKVSVWQFIGTFLNMVFNLDSSFFQSLFGIFVPGKLTKDYFEGKRKKYAHPLRLFFIIAALHISVLGIYINNQMQNNDDFLTQDITFDKNIINKKTAELDSILLEKGLTDSLVVRDSLRNTFELSLDQDSNNPPQELEEDTISEDAIDTSDLVFTKDIPFVDDSLFLNIFYIPADSLKSHSIEETIEIYDIQGFFYQTVLRQRIKMINEPQAFLRSLIANLIWMMFILLPVIALFMKMMYIRRKKYFVEHLVFLFHWHAFAFILMSVFLLLRPWISIAWIFFVWLLILIFGFIALRRYYRDGFIKACFKYGLILAFYILTIIVLIFIFALITSLIF